MKIEFKKAMNFAQEILLAFIDINLNLFEIFDTKKFYRVPIEAFNKFRLNDKSRFHREIHRLENQGFIKKYYDDKIAFFEISDKGIQKLRKHISDQMINVKPKYWDKKWHLVIFDIPNEETTKRNILRSKLVEFGFLKLQESVYIYPFNCLNEINLIKAMYNLSKYVQYIVADHVETEINLVHRFLEEKTLTKNMLK